VRNYLPEQKIIRKSKKQQVFQAGKSDENVFLIMSVKIHYLGNFKTRFSLIFLFILLGVFG